MISNEIIDKIEEEYECFIDEELPIDEESCINVDEKIKEDLQVFPKELLYAWEKFGISSYGKGLWWHVNPRDFDEVVEEWLEETPFWEPEINAYHVIGRTAYGKLYLWGEKTGQNLEIDPLWGIIYHSESDEKYLNSEKTWISITSALWGELKDSYDKKDDKDKPLFSRIHKKLGTLKYNEMYTSVPIPIFSGGISVKNAAKEDLFMQLSILRQAIEEPEIIDFEIWPQPVMPQQIVPKTGKYQAILPENHSKQVELKLDPMAYNSFTKGDVFTYEGLESYDISLLSWVYTE